MKLNARTALVSSKILLVPYEAHHVETYSAWMEDEEIREATASERLTLDEEYQMQQRWRDDADKLTFISCLPPARKTTDGDVIIAQEDDSPSRMVGDVNLFLYDNEEESESDSDEDGYGRSGSGIKQHSMVGEIELMVAGKIHQGRGLGRASLLLFLHYVLRNRSQIMAHRYLTSAFPDSLIVLGPPVLSSLRVKIHRTNARSIRLFESVGFVKKSETASYFGEFDFVLESMEVGRIEELMRAYGIEDFAEREYVYEDEMDDDN
ncbi:N-acetyltransferase 9 [Rhizina undulata]